MQHCLKYLDKLQNACYNKSNLKSYEIIIILYSDNLNKLSANFLKAK